MARRLAVVLVLVLVVLGAGFAISSWLAEEPVVERAQPAFRTQTTTPQPALEEDKSAVIETVQGRAIRRVPGQTAAPVVKGDRLPAASTVETTGGSVTLVTHGGAQVVVSDESLLRVAASDAEGVDIVLARGRAEAKTGGAETPFRMGFEGSDAVATATDGDFAAVSDGAGQVAVASSRGDVDLSAQGQSVTIGEGEQSVVRPSMPPSAPKAIPSSFFLKVRKPGRTKQPKATLRGRTAPGSIVRIEGQAVQVGDSGQFETEVSLSRGRNAVTVSARDAKGREASRDVDIVYERPDPTLRSKVVW